MEFVDKVALGQVFFEFLRFSLSISFHNGSPSYVTRRMNNRPVGGRSSETYRHEQHWSNTKEFGAVEVKIREFSTSTSHRGGCIAFLPTQTLDRKLGEAKWRYERSILKLCDTI
jgi:hypothetical protein